MTRNEIEAFAEMDDTAGIQSQNLRNVRQAFHDTQPTEWAEQQQSMPFWESAGFIGAVLLAFYCFLLLVEWLAEQAHGL